MIIPFRSRQQDPFEALVLPHIEGLYRLAYRFTGQRSDAEDLVQELLVRLYPKAEEMAAIGQLRAWMARSLYHLHVDHVRRRDRSPVVQGEELMTWAEETVAETAPGPEATVSAGQLRQDVETALQRLNEEQRTVVVLHDMEGYSLVELEIILETPIGTLKSRLHRARMKLRELLTMEPFTTAERLSQ